MFNFFSIQCIDIDQLTQILRIVGSPNDDLYEKISSEDVSFCLTKNVYMLFFIDTVFMSLCFFVV